MKEVTSIIETNSNTIIIVTALITAAFSSTFTFAFSQLSARIERVRAHRMTQIRELYLPIFEFYQKHELEHDLFSNLTIDVRKEFYDLIAPKSIYAENGTQAPITAFCNSWYGFIAVEDENKTSRNYVTADDKVFYELMACALTDYKMLCKKLKHATPEIRVSLRDLEKWQSQTEG